MSSKLCFPLCKHFRCTQGYLSIKRNKQGKKIILCNWVGDLCTGIKCKYASCNIGKLRSDGTCSLWTPRSPQKKTFVSQKIEEPDKIPIPLKDKLLKKLNNKNLKKFR